MQNFLHETFPADLWHSNGKLRVVPRSTPLLSSHLALPSILPPSTPLFQRRNERLFSQSRPPLIYTTQAVCYEDPKQGTKIGIVPPHTESRRVTVNSSAYSARYKYAWQNENRRAREKIIRTAHRFLLRLKAKPSGSLVSI